MTAGRNGARVIVTTPAPAVSNTPTTDAQVKASPRYKAVRRIKNVANTQFNSRIRLYQRSIASAKDAGKVKVLQGKIEALQFALQVVNEA